MQHTTFQLMLITTLATVAACQQTAPKEPAGPSLASQWQGRWIGPEGTFLELQPQADGVAITVQSLDGPAHYQGTEHAGGIHFIRDGKTETVRAGDGEATGMKWLLDKQNCLVIQLGEGFCRD